MRCAGRLTIVVAVLCCVAASSAAASATARGARNLAATSSVKSGLVAAFAPAHGVRPAEIGGTFPGSVFYAYDTTTRSYWAVASFVPARSDPPGVADTFQDAGANGIFSRPAGGTWRFRGSGAPLLCSEERVVPKAVLQVWRTPAKSPACP